MSDNTAEKIRINKYIAQYYPCSRRKADELIEKNTVKVNGSPATQGMAIDKENDTVTVYGKTLIINETAQDEKTIIFHKPIEVVTTLSDPQRRRTVMELLPHELQNKHFVPVGRLDYFSEGLLLLTTDGDLCYRLTHPKWHLPKVYEITIREDIQREFIDKIQKGFTLITGEELAPMDIRIIKKEKGKNIFQLTLYQGINRQIRRICLEHNLTILRLQRIAFANITLGSLYKGQWRYLTNEEQTALYKLTQLDTLLEDS